LFDDFGGASNDITICEVDESTSPSEKKNTVIYHGDEGMSCSKSGKNKDLAVSDSKDQLPSQNSLEINTAELIALNDAAIEGKAPPTVARTRRDTADNVMETTEIPPTQRDKTPATAGSGNKHKDSNNSQLSVNSSSATVRNEKDVRSQKGEVIKKEERNSEREGRGKRPIKERSLPAPDVLQSDSLSSNYLPPTQVGLQR
jgi:hypothetical protein